VPKKNVAGFVGSAHRAHFLRSVLIALLEQPAATMHDILRIFSDKEFRKQIARTLKNQTVGRLLETEYEKFSASYRVDAAAPIQNRCLSCRPNARPDAKFSKA
jgi:hypothetical protein